MYLCSNCKMHKKMKQAITRGPCVTHQNCRKFCIHKAILANEIKPGVMNNSSCKAETTSFVFIKKNMRDKTAEMFVLFQYMFCQSFIAKFSSSSSFRLE